MRFVVPLLFCSSVMAQTVYDTKSLVDTNNVNTSTVNSNSTVTSTNNNVNTSTSTSTSTSTNTNINVNSGDQTIRNINTSTGDVTYRNYNINSGAVTYNNNNVNTSTNTNVNTGTMTYNNNNVSASTSASTSSSTSNNTNVNQNVQTGDMTNRNINDTNITQKVIQPPPTAMSPTMMSGGNADLCSTGTSGAVQTQIFGVSSGGTVRDLNCERLKLSKTLYDMGMKVAAVATMCQDRRVWDAMMSAGTPCPFEGQIGEKAKVAWEQNPGKIPAKEESKDDDMLKKLGLGAALGVLVGKLF